MNKARKVDGFDDPLRGLLGYELRRASTSAMSALTNALTPLGLRPTEASVLVIIAENPGCTQSDIGRALSAATANLVPLIAGLVSSGYIRREPAGPRALALSLTPAGRDLVARVKKTFSDHEDRIAGQLGEANRQQMIAWLRLIGANASPAE